MSIDERGIAPVLSAHDELPGRIVLPDAPAEVAGTLARGGAVAWSEPLTITTYEAGEPSAYPMYLDHRVYQGSSGRIYPVPFVEQVADKAVSRQWQAIHLENAYIRLVVLPELGGRIHIGYDKTTDYDFFYRNNVIKPALVGLGGPWISGGIEFNWPQHHRPATYLPVETEIEWGEDGSVTVWCHDHDPFERMSAQHGIRLRPDSSVVELDVRLHNRTSERQTFLWWANVAAAVNDDYQAFFPEDVRYVADHARRALTAFPAADRPYYGVDYPAVAAEKPGADRIDFYRNVQVPTSYMVVETQDDFFGGYDHGARAGFVHWAERRVAPGKKMWTWGDAPFGHAWDRQLTDADGPYVELMAGVYTDNQPDFTWLLPGETKIFTQYWYPIPAIGPAHQATPDAAVSVDRTDGVVASFAVTSPRVGAQLRLMRDGAVVASDSVDLAPGQVAIVRMDGSSKGVRAEMLDAEGRVLVAWEPAVANEEEPWMATEPPAPADIETVEELYLTGLHLMQYRHPTRSPLTWWNEALRRDPGDVRTNTAMADRAYRAGEYAAALGYAEVAIERLTRRNWQPTDTEAFYIAGLALARLGRTQEAEHLLGKAGWDGTWANAAGVELTRLLASRGQNRAALRVLESLDGVVGNDARRTALEVVVRRRLGQDDRASELLARALATDPLDAGLRVLARTNEPTDAGMLLDTALDMWKAGERAEALRLLEAATTAPVTPAGNFRPVALYTAAAVLEELGQTEEAQQRRLQARASDLTWAFPHGLDAHDVLGSALDADPGDAVAKLLLGMLLYGHRRRRDAHVLWENAIELGLEHPLLLRNAALASYNIAHDDEAAWSRYGQAVAAAPHDARLRYEQDQLAARLGHSSAERLARLEPVEDLVLTRDDFTIEYVGLLVLEGKSSRAYDILTTRQFHPWEGGEGRSLAAWDATLAALGRPLADPPANLAEARPAWVPPVAVHEDGVTDYFATSLPELLLFAREEQQGV